MVSFILKLVTRTCLNIEASLTRLARWGGTALSPSAPPPQEREQDDKLQSCTRCRLDKERTAAASARKEEEEESRDRPAVSEVTDIQLTLHFTAILAAEPHGSDWFHICSPEVSLTSPPPGRPADASAGRLTDWQQGRHLTDSRSSAWGETELIHTELGGGVETVAAAPWRSTLLPGNLLCSHSPSCGGCQVSAQLLFTRTHLFTAGSLYFSFFFSYTKKYFRHFWNEGT